MKKNHSILAVLLCLFSSLAFGASYTKTDNVISTSGGPVGFPGGITTPTSLIGDIWDSTAALTLVAGANVAAVVTPVTLNCSRFGNTASCFGQVSIDPTAGTTLSTFTLTTPVVRASNFTGTLGATGSVGLPGAVASGVCSATNAAKTISCTYTSGGTAVELVNVSYKYQITGN